MQRKSRSDFSKELIEWAKDHYWNSLEQEKALILKHLLAFTKDSDINPYEYACCEWLRGCSCSRNYKTGENNPRWCCECTENFINYIRTLNATTNNDMRQEGQ